MEILKFIFKVLVFFFKPLGRVVSFLFLGVLTTQTRGAKFLKESEVKKILTPRNKGLLIDGKSGRLSEQESYKHLAIIAPTGAGKTTAYIAPNILTLATERCSVVVSDPSGELFQTTSRYMKSRGFGVFVLDPLNLPQSIRFNPLEEISSIDEIGQIATVLIQSGAGTISTKDRFWYDGAIEIIEILIQCLKYAPEEYCNLHNVLYLIQNFGSNGKDLDDFIIKYAQEQNIFNRWTGFTKGGNEKTTQSYISTALTSLKALGNSNIARLLSKNTIDFRNMRKQKSILYLITPSNRAEYYRFILNLFYTQFFNFCMSRPLTRRDLPIYVLYDEFGHSTIPDFSSIITTIRKYKVSISIVLQSLSQLTQRYGEAGSRTILEGGISSKLFFSGLGPDTSREVERLLGKVVTEDLYDYGRLQHRDYNLLNAGEVRTLESDKIIFVTGNKQPMLLKTTPCFKNPKFKHYMKREAFRLPENDTNDNLPYIPL